MLTKKATVFQVSVSKYNWIDMIVIGFVKTQILSLRQKK